MLKNYKPENLLADCTDYKEDMAISDGHSALIEATKDLLVAQEEKRQAQNSLKMKHKQADKYGDANGQYSKDIAKLENAIFKCDAEIKTHEEKISAFAYILNDREYNQAVMKTLDICGSSANVKFMGEDALKYERVKNHVKQAVQAFVARLASVDIDKCKGNYVQLLHKNEYKVIKKEIEYMSYGLYGQKYPYKANEIGLILIGCVNATGKQLKVKADVSIMNTLISVINGVVDPNNKQQTKEN